MCMVSYFMYLTQATMVSHLAYISNDLTKILKFLLTILVTVEHEIY